MGSLSDWPETITDWIAGYFQTRRNSLRYTGEMIEISSLIEAFCNTFCDDEEIPIDAWSPDEITLYRLRLIFWYYEDIDPKRIIPLLRSFFTYLAEENLHPSAGSIEQKLHELEPHFMEYLQDPDGFERKESYPDIAMMDIEDMVLPEFECGLNIRENSERYTFRWMRILSEGWGTGFFTSGRFLDIGFDDPDFGRIILATTIHYLAEEYGMRIDQPDPVAIREALLYGIAEEYDLSNEKLYWFFPIVAAFYEYASDKGFFTDIPP